MAAPLSINGAGARGLGAWRITNNQDDYVTGESIPMGSNITLAGPATIDAEFDATLNGNISDNGSFPTLTKTGPGTLAFAGNNTNMSAEILATSGTVEISSNTASPGNGSIYASPGSTVYVDSGVTVTCPVIVAGTGYLGAGAVSGYAGTFANILYLIGNTTFGGSETITGPITDYVGSNTLTVEGGAVFAASNSYKGGTIIQANAYATAKNSFAFGPGPVTINQYGQVNLSGNINVANPLYINGGNGVLTPDIFAISGNSTVSGVMTLTASNQVNLDAAAGATLTLTGQVLDGIYTAGLKTIDAGTVYLAGGSASTFKGGLSDNGGILDIINPNAVGAGNVYVNNPAFAHFGTDASQLQVQGGITINRPLFLSGGNGLGTSGLIRSTSGSNFWSGGLTVGTALAPTSAIGVDAGSTLTFLSSAVGGTGTINKIGLGRLVLESAVNLPVVNANVGEVQFGSGVSMPVGLSVNVINGAAAEVNDLLGGGVSGAGTFNLIGNGVGFTGALRATGTNTNATLSGNIHLLDNSAIGVDNGDTLTLNAPGTIDDANNAYALTKVGGGVLALNGNSTYTGGLNINGGTVKVSSDPALGPSINQVTINNGAKLEFTQTATTTRNINANNGTIQIDTGDDLLYIGNTVTGGYLRGTGTHQFGPNSSFIGTTVDSGATVYQVGAANLTNFTNGGAFTDFNGGLVWDAGANAASGTINFFGNAALDSFTNNGVMTINPGVTVTNTSANLYLAGGSRLYMGTGVNPGGTLTLTNSTTVEVNGALLVNNGKINGTTDVNYGGTAEGTGSYGPVNVTFGGVFQPGFTPIGAQIPVQSASVTSLTGAGTVDNQSAGGSLTLTDNSNTLSTFSGVIQNTTGTLGLTLNGPGGLTLLTTTLPGGMQSTNTYTGGTVINGGTLNIAAAGALPAGGTVVNNAALNILANSTSGNISGAGTLTVGSPAKLTIAAGTGTSAQGALIINPGATLDITSNNLAINYGAAPDPAATIRGYLKSGSNGGIWTGTGLTSSVVAAQVAATIAAHTGGVYGIGYVDGGVDNNQSAKALVHAVGNQSVYTPALIGDTNLDGSVTFIDLGIVAQNLGAINTDWEHGDFNYDGTTNFLDIGLLAQNLNRTVLNTPLSELIPDASPAVAAQWNLAVAEIQANQTVPTNVPEPGMIGLLGLGAAGLLTRRRRR
jgi:autotransporter-associated beta strand protein